ncbi:hypothetical protein [Bacillus thuringiensis]|uniref:hypothetical protein n=1 Tax=Bacillus thuringiensis TaxID=1428 RepID=UPI0015D5071F|nr:hypothetical protein [Bacillus thuringiensis]
MVPLTGSHPSANISYELECLFSVITNDSFNFTVAPVVLNLVEFKTAGANSRFIFESFFFFVSSLAAVACVSCFGSVEPFSFLSSSPPNAAALAPSTIKPINPKY